MKGDLLFREITLEEIPLVWTIDRSQEIHGVYRHINGELILLREHHLHSGWSPEDESEYGPWLADSHRRGGYLAGVFRGGRMVAVVVLDNRFIGENRDMLQLMFLHVDRSLRGTGIGKKLFHIAASKAREMGAGKLYISSCPSKHTVEFYFRMGSTVAGTTVPELFEMEPDDIHMEYEL